MAAARTRQKHFYVCSQGHQMGAPDAQRKCRAMPNGKPCKGKLKAVK